MIKLTYILNEGMVGKPLNVKTAKSISVSDAISGIEKNCKDAVTVFKSITDTKPGLFRGYKVYMEYGIIDPKKRERTGSQNLYNALTSILPSWKDYPKRSYSVMFSNRYDVARSYGDIYWLFPTDGANIGRIKNRDAWYGFPYTAKRMGQTHSSIDMMMSRFGNFIAKASTFKQSLPPEMVPFSKSYQYFASKEYTVSNTNTLLTQMNKLTKLIYRYAEKYVEAWGEPTFASSYPDPTYYIAKDILNNFKGNWIEYFDGLMNPEKNDIERVAILDIPHIHDANEFWTDAECIMVNAREDMRNYTSLKYPSVCGKLFKERIDHSVKSGTLHHLGIDDY